MPKPIFEKIVTTKTTQMEQAPEFPYIQYRSRVFVQRDGLLMVNVIIHKSELENKTKILESAMKLFGLDVQLSEKIIEQNMFPLNFYTAKSFVKDNKYYLVGDAAYNVHFFTASGYNNGAHSALVLSLDPENYETRMQWLSYEAEYQVRLRIIELNLTMDRCNERNDEELYSELISNGLTIKKGELSKKEICMYLNFFLVPLGEKVNLSHKALREPPKEVIQSFFVPQQFLAHIFIEQVCEHRSIQNQLKFLYKRLVKLALMRGDFLEQFRFKSLPEYSKILENIEEFEEPSNKGSREYKIWLAYHDFKSGDPLQRARKHIKKMPRALHINAFTACIYLDKFKESPTFENFLKVYYQL